MTPIPEHWHLEPFVGGGFAVPAQWRAVATPAWFDPAQPGATPVAEGGRQAAWFVAGAYGAGVLRHYRRGGLRARLGRESYAWLGVSRVRALAECRVLDRLIRSGVRVPEPLGAAFWRKGLLYRNAILIERIPDARVLASHLETTDPGAVARAIQAMHQAGVWHADLNAYNILLDAQDQVWLIDFDRARAGVVSAEQQDKNLLRLKRSLVKVAGARGAQWWDDLSRCFP